MEIKNKQLNAVYNGNQTIIEGGFGMVSNFILPVLNRMKLEGLISESGSIIVQTIFSFKHTEKNPFPSNQLLADYSGYTLNTVKGALKSIRKSGILNIMKMVDEKTGKEKRNSMYDFAPFFELLEKFVIEFRIKKTKDIKIAELLKVSVEKPKSKTDFSAIQKAPVQAPSESVQDAPQATEEVTVTTLPEAISNKLNTLQINAEGIEAVQVAYNKLGAEVSVEMFVEKMVVSSMKKDFASYFTTCITNAYNNKEVVAPRSSGTRKITRDEKTPEWLEKHTADRRNPNRTHAPTIEEMTFEQLLVKEKFVIASLVKLPFAESLKQEKQLIDICKLKFKEEGVQ